MLNTYHFAYSGQDDEGVVQDAALLVDEDVVGFVDGVLLAEKVKAFLRACGWQKVLVTIQ